MQIHLHRFGSKKLKKSTNRPAVSQHVWGQVPHKILQIKLMKLEREWQTAIPQKVGKLIQRFCFAEAFVSLAELDYVQQLYKRHCAMSFCNLNTLLRMYFICMAILNIRDIGMFISRVLFKAKQVLINTPRSGKNYLWTKPDNSNINDKNNTGIRYVLQHLTQRFHLKAYARTEWGLWAIRRGGIKFDFFSFGNPYLCFTWCTLQTDRHAKCQRYGKYICVKRLADIVMGGNSDAALLRVLWEHFLLLLHFKGILTNGRGKVVAIYVFFIG